MKLGSVSARATCAAGVILALALPAQARTARHETADKAMRGPVQTTLGQNYAEGTIIISLSQRRLYLVTGQDSAIKYPVAVGKAGKAWTGTAYVNGKFVRPDWMPPAVVKKDNPKLPDIIKGGTAGNPMGERALTLNLEEIAIHGTAQSMRKSIGSAASYGCIRMLNEDVMDLFDRVRVGTPVVAIR